MSSISDAEIQKIVQQVLQRKVQPEISQPAAEPVAVETGQGDRKVAIANDHGGVDFKNMLKAYLIELGYRVVDFGTSDTKSVDYPDYAYMVAEMVSEGKAWRGIVIDGAGIGSCMAANKVPGVRCAMCYDYATAVNSREHNNANVLSLGAGLLGPALAKQIVKTWLETGFGGGRHAKRVDKIMAIEKKFMKNGE
ncbi:MAG: ribose 5-phosphate isomerase B [Anaerolineaceae bacterium]|jgi:ribose 5-phosphate isomerase B|nr:ribose 5-phosphate isomerase B [Anaerolineaceae bacterium]